jgi:uncharacterized membrane protein YdjX (TVP38/TMEM64 family)
VRRPVEGARRQGVVIGQHHDVGARGCRVSDELVDRGAGAGLAAPVAALVGWVLLTPAPFPGTVLAAAGGLAFGAVGGAVLAVGGAVLGGLAAFILARTAAGRAGQRLMARSPRLARVNEQLERRGFTAILAARLMPGIPATALHYAAGASPVRYRAFTAAIAIGALVRTAPYALLGQGLATGSPLALALAIVPITIGGAGGLVLMRHLRRASR